MNLTTEYLGNPMEFGEGHGFVGVATVSDQIHPLKVVNQYSSLRQNPPKGNLA
jgi:hypothetical protein